MNVEYFGDYPEEYGCNGVIFLRMIASQHNIKINWATMDPRVREVMEGAMGQCNNEIRSIEPLIDTKMASTLDTCYGRNSSNPERFA